MDRFVLAGKASTVFRLIELKVQREVELKNSIQKVYEEGKKVEAHVAHIVNEARPCRHDRYGLTRCNVPYDMKCEDTDCKILRELKMG